MNKLIAVAAVFLCAAYGAAHAQSGGSATTNGTNNAGMPPSSGVETNGMSGGQTMNGPETLPTAAAAPAPKHKRSKKAAASADSAAAATAAKSSGDGKAAY